jgi:hypothetical protein
MPLVIAAPLSMIAEQRSALEQMARSSSLPHGAVVQAQALLWAADGLANEEIGRRTVGGPPSVWHRRPG